MLLQRFDDLLLPIDLLLLGFRDVPAKGVEIDRRGMHLVRAGGALLETCFRAPQEFLQRLTSLGDDSREGGGLSFFGAGARGERDKCNDQGGLHSVQRCWARGKRQAFCPSS